MEDASKTFAAIVRETDNIAILSGAGVSTASGIRDFRGKDGLYQDKVFGLSAERILSKSFFGTYPDLFYRYYLNHFAIPEHAQPNSIHIRTKQLADTGKLVGVVTQNVDGLYQKVGLAENLLVEIHGNGNRWVCMKCKQEVQFSEARFDEKSGNYLSDCHDFLIRPAIVLYDEPFDSDNVKRMKAIHEAADTLVVMGTSLNIVAHRDAVQRFKGRIVLLNNAPVALESRDWDNVLIGELDDTFRW